MLRESGSHPETGSSDRIYQAAFQADALLAPTMLGIVIFNTQILPAKFERLLKTEHGKPGKYIPSLLTL
jgi:hypothetical protein